MFLWGLHMYCMYTLTYTCACIYVYTCICIRIYMFICIQYGVTLPPRTACNFAGESKEARKTWLQYIGWMSLWTCRGWHCVDAREWLSCQKLGHQSMYSMSRKNLLEYLPTCTCGIGQKCRIWQTKFQVCFIRELQVSLKEVYRYAQKFWVFTTGSMAKYVTWNRHGHFSCKFWFSLLLFNHRE